MIAQPTRTDRLLTTFMLFVCASLISLALQPITHPDPAAAAPPAQIVVVTATPRPAGDQAGGSDPGPAPGPPEQVPAVLPAAATAAPDPPAPAAAAQAAPGRARRLNLDGTYEYADRPGWIYATGADGQEQLVRVVGIETVNGENFGAAANAQAPPPDQVVVPESSSAPSAPRGGCAARHGRCH
jgi:hypothetical protein